MVDVLIIGGGPAGLALGIAARRHGLRVAVVDRGAPGADKACGEGLMPDAVAALAALGVEVPVSDAQPIRGIRFVGHGREFEAAFPHGSGLGLRRTTLHRLLTQHACQAGVELHWHTTVPSGEASQMARFVVGADGENSAMRRWAGLDAAVRASRRFGFRQHFEIEPWSDCVEVHWARDCQIYVTPVGARLVGVACLSSSPYLRLEQALRQFPAVARRLQGAPAASEERGGVSASRRLKRVATGTVALIGDASGSVDAVTGEGLGLAFKQALALGEALATGDLRRYQRQHDLIRRRPAMMAGLLLLLDRRERLRRGVFSAFAAHPALFSRVLSFHTGALCVG